MKFVNTFALRQGAQAEYKRRHDALWPEMAELMRRAGLKNYSIWNVGTQLIEYYECANPENARRVISESAAKARWDAYMSDILALDEAGMTPLACMFDFNSTDEEE